MKPSLDYFIAIAEELNISAAAKKLNISQQSLSAYLKNLEQYYNTTLLERRPVMKLTESGRMLYTMGKRLETMRSELDYSISFRTEKNVFIRIGVLPFGGMFVMDYVPIIPFSKTYRNASLEIVEASSEELLGLLKNGGINMVISNFSKTSLPAGFTTAKLGTERQFVMMTQHTVKTWLSYSWEEALDRFSEGITMEELASCPIIGPPANSTLYRQIISYSQANNLELNEICSAYNAQSALDMCFAGFGAAFVPESYVNFLKNSGEFWARHNLHAFPISGVLSARDVMLIYRNDEPLSREYRTIVDLTIQRAKDKERGLYKPVGKLGP